METKNEKIKKLKNDYSTIVESLYSLSKIIRTLTDEIIFTDIEPEDFKLILDVEHEIFMCRKKIGMATSGVNSISDIIE